jgi:hypothetical protein
VEIAIRTERDDAAVTESLCDWLHADPDLGPSVRQGRTPPRPGQMGGVMDAVIVAVGSGGAVTALAPLLKSWLLRPRHAHIKLEVETSPNGKRSVTLDADRVRKEDIDEIIAALKDVE